MSANDSEKLISFLISQGRTRAYEEEKVAEDPDSVLAEMEEQASTQEEKKN